MILGTEIVYHGPLFAQCWRTYSENQATDARGFAAAQCGKALPYR